MNETIRTILTRRSIRKFTQQPIPEALWEAMADAARLAPSGGNMQPLRFVFVKNPEMVKQVFPLLKWAAYLPDGAPKAGEEPTGYIVLVQDTEYFPGNRDNDAGAAAENIQLAAWSEGVGSCWMGSINIPELHKLLELPENYKILTLVALGYPAMSSDVCEMTDSVRYFYNDEGEFLVPKRSREGAVILR